MRVNSRRQTAAWSQHLRDTRMQLLHLHRAAARAHPRGADDVLTVAMELERGAPFCANAACALHVRLLDPQVEGGGNWVTLADGRIFGRGRFGNALLCDACGTRRGPVRIGALRVTN
jgi:hypothetical protein